MLDARTGQSGGRGHRLENAMVVAALAGFALVLVWLAGRLAG